MVNAPVSGSFGSISMGNLTLDFTDMHRQMDKALRLLSAGHSLVLSQRCQQLKSFLDPKFHYLLWDDNPITEELLGDNVDQKVCEAIKVSDAAQKLKLQSRTPKFKQRQNYTPGRRGNHRFIRYRPYNREYRDNSHPYSRQSSYAGNFSGYQTSQTPSQGYSARGRFSKARYQCGAQRYARRR